MNNLTFLKETTDWGEYETPNNTYIVDDKGYLVAFIREGETRARRFATPIKKFDKRYRTFEKVKVTPSEWVWADLRYSKKKSATYGPYTTK